MPAPVTLALFALATLALTATPGPAVLYVVGQSLGGGRRQGFGAMFGVEAGEAVYIAAAAAGITALLADIPFATAGLRYVGALYLVLLGVQAWRSPTDAAVGRPRQSFRGAFLKGLGVQLLNPKVAVFFLAYFPLFLSGAQPTAPQVAVLGAVYLAVALLVDGAYVVMSSSIGARLQRSRSGSRWLSRVTASVYVVLGVIAAVSGGRPTASAG